MQTLTELRLTKDQQEELHRLCKTLREQGLNASLAYLGAQVLLQDKLLGLEARTPTQQETMFNIACILGSDTKL